MRVKRVNAALDLIDVFLKAQLLLAPLHDLFGDSNNCYPYNSSKRLAEVLRISILNINRG